MDNAVDGDRNELSLNPCQDWIQKHTKYHQASYCKLFLAFPSLQASFEVLHVLANQS
jgi:hypothetical protein